jgi:hypothetical protein
MFLRPPLMALHPPRILAAVVLIGSLFSGCSEPPADLLTPEAILVDAQTDFGKVTVGVEVEHTFTIQNKGNAILVLGEPRPVPAGTPYEMRCELSSREIPVGGSATARVRIRPMKTSRKLYAGVLLKTNVGENGEIRFGGKLVVENLFELRLENGEEEYDDRTDWKLPFGPDGEPLDYKGTLHSSGLENFRVVSIKSTNPLIQARAVPLTKANLNKLEAKSGYTIVVSAKGMKHIGQYSGSLTFKTDPPGLIEKSVLVKGIRYGPLMIINPKDVKWRPHSAVIDLGRFQASQGRTTTMLFVMNAPESGGKWVWKKAESDFSALKVSISNDKKRSTPTRHWSQLTLTVPPQQKGESRNRLNPIHVTIVSNHPAASPIRLQVLFTSHD